MRVLLLFPLSEKKSQNGTSSFFKGKKVERTFLSGTLLSPSLRMRLLLLYLLVGMVGSFKSLSQVEVPFPPSLPIPLFVEAMLHQK